MSGEAFEAVAIVRRMTCRKVLPRSGHAPSPARGRPSVPGRGQKPRSAISAADVPRNGSITRITRPWLSLWYSAIRLDGVGNRRVAADDQQCAGRCVDVLHRRQVEPVILSTGNLAAAATQNLVDHPVGRAIERINSTRHHQPAAKGMPFVAPAMAVGPYRRHFRPSDPRPR